MFKISVSVIAIVATALLVSACNHENDRAMTPDDNTSSSDHGFAIAGTTSGGSGTGSGTGSPSGTTDSGSGTTGTGVSGTTGTGMPDSGSGSGTTTGSAGR
jgi:hypothetical protein